MKILLSTEQSRDEYITLEAHDDKGHRMSATIFSFADDVEITLEGGERKRVVTHDGYAKRKADTKTWMTNNPERTKNMTLDDLMNYFVIVDDLSKEHQEMYHALDQAMKALKEHKITIAC